MLFIRGGIFYFLLFIFMIAEIQHKVKKKLGVVQLFYEREDSVGGQYELVFN